MKLHLGCGKRHIPGFTHIDAVEYPHVDHVATIDNLGFMGSDTVDLIYTCHVLEHFRRKSLRVSVPDFARLCDVYQKHRDINLVIGPIFGRQDYLYNIHYNVFDEHSLAAVLQECGFQNVRRYDWRDTEHAHIDDYSQAYVPHMDKDNGVLISLNVEATKAPR